MRFGLAYHRAIVGNDIEVSVQADGTELIAEVRVVLDGFDLAEDRVDPPSVQYERTFLKAGSAGPQMQHSLIAFATDDNGKIRTAIRKWQDVT